MPARSLRLSTGVACLAWFVTAAPTLFAQAELTTFDELVEVSEVTLDVLATDAEGRMILGLEKDDFVVEENGEPVEITSVDYYATRYGEQVGIDDEVPSSRFLIFFFHDQTRFRAYGNRLIIQQLRASQQSRRWVTEHMLPSDWAAVVRHDGELVIYQDLTQDREALLEALQRAASGKKPRTFTDRRRNAIDRPVSITRRLASPESKREDIHVSLGRLAEATGYLVGRKNLMMFTIGFGKDEYASLTTRPDPKLYPALEAKLNDNNVAVYPIDLTPPGRAPRFRDALGQIAEDTGGVYYEDFVGFLNPLKEVSEENAGYYLLSFVSARPAGEIGYQRLEVRAQDPGVEIRARRGYRYGL